MKKELGDAPLPIGGWLILVGIRLIGGFFLNARPSMQPLGPQLNETGQILRILFFICIAYILVVSSLYIKRHKAFPRAYIVLEIVSIVLNTTTFIISTSLRDAFSIAYFAALLLINTLWILYMLFSIRVKKTFVCRWNDTLDQSLVDKVNGGQL